jgi:hypothetical protein
MKFKVYYLNKDISKFGFKIVEYPNLEAVQKRIKSRGFDIKDFNIEQIKGE